MRRATVDDVEAILVEEWQADGYSVYLRRSTPRELIVPGRDYAGTFTEAYAPEHAPATASLFLPSSALEAIVAAGTGLKPPSEAQATHLADAVAVRDRVLDELSLAVTSLRIATEAGR